jgi:hypothetical protein
MEGHPLPASSTDQPLGWRDLRLLALVILLSAGIRTWLIWHTSVPARDGIGFIRYAWQLQHRPWREVVRENAHPPGYPLVVLALSLPVRHLIPGSEPLVMQLSAQAASGLAAILLVIPTFLLGRDLFNRRVGIGAAFLFQLLPVPVRITSDALSEGVFLLLIVTALVVAVRAMRRRSPSAFAASGVLSALAYLTRPEGILVAVCTGVVLLIGQAVPLWRRPRNEVAFCFTTLVLGCAVFVAPYMAVIGGVTNKPTARQIMGTVDAEPEIESRLQPSVGPGGPMFASLMAVRWHLRGNELRVWQTIAGVGYEIGKAFRLVWLPALCGLWYFRSRFRPLPEAWVLLLVCAGLALMLGQVAWVRGYISDRHTLFFVLCGSIWAVAAIEEVAKRLPGLHALRFLSGKAWGTLMIVAFAVLGVPDLLKPMHANRAGHRLAGDWLAEHADPHAALLDPFCWADYYSGRAFQDREASIRTPSDSAEIYVIAEDSKLAHRWLRGRNEAARLIQRGVPVYRCPLQRGGEAEVIVYRVPAGFGAASAN